MSDLVKFEEVTIIDLFKTNGMEPVLEAIKSEVYSYNLSTERATDRKEIASLAAKISKSKTYLDGVGKEIVSEWKKKAKVIDAERKRTREQLDDLKEEIRAPLTAWEEKEKFRAEKAFGFYNCLKGMLDITPHDGLNAIEAAIDQLSTMEIYDDLKEYKEDATELMGKAEEHLGNIKLEAINIKKEKEELEALRIEKAEREEKDRLQKIKDEAAKEAETRRAAEAAKAEEEKAQALVRAERDKEEAVRQAREDEKRKAKLEAELAEQRANDVKHRKKINNEALESLVRETQIGEEFAKLVVIAVAKGVIENMEIKY